MTAALFANVSMRESYLPPAQLSLLKQATAAAIIVIVALGNSAATALVVVTLGHAAASATIIIITLRDSAATATVVIVTLGVLRGSINERGCSCSKERAGWINWRETGSRGRGSGRRRKPAVLSTLRAVIIQSRLDLVDKLRVALVQAPVQLCLFQLEPVADLVAHCVLIHALWFIVIIEPVVIPFVIIFWEDAASASPVIIIIALDDSATVDNVVIRLDNSTAAAVSIIAGLDDHPSRG